MGIINNEKYKGDILLKNLTVDPISKRRLENLGEEDRYYIHDHHEPIITEEQFERAQEMRRRRNGNRKCGVTRKREKFSRQFAFSCMVECGFCALIFLVGDGTVALSIKRRYGSALNQQKKEEILSG